MASVKGFKGIEKRWDFRGRADDFRDSGDA